MNELINSQFFGFLKFNFFLNSLNSFKKRRVEEAEDPLLFEG